MKLTLSEERFETILEDLHPRYHGIARERWTDFPLRWELRMSEYDPEAKGSLYCPDTSTFVPIDRDLLFDLMTPEETKQFIVEFL